MSIEELKTYILEKFKKLTIVEAHGDLFFMHNKNDKLPFATIITQDNEYDNVSNLYREGFFRLNVSLDKESFNSLFGGITEKKGLENYMNLGLDFTQENVIMPHPTYGAMNWVCVINPTKETIEKSLKKSLEVCYKQSQRKKIKSRNRL